MQSINVPTQDTIYPRVGAPLHLTSNGKDVWFGKVIVSPKMGYFTHVQPSEQMANDAAKELLQKLIEVKK